MNYVMYLNLFQDYLEMKGYSKRTIDSYIRCSKRFFFFISKHYPRIKSVEQITKQVIYDYQSYLKSYKTRKGKQYSNTTYNGLLIPIRQLFNFLLKKDYILRDPTRDIVFAKMEQRLTRNILTEEEALALVDSIKPVDPISIRNRAIIELFYGCGIRTTELCELQTTNVNLKEQVVTIKGKGNKIRTVPIGQYCCYYIELYMEKSRKYMLRGINNDPGNLFLTYRGKPFDKSTINKSVMRKIMKNLNIKKHITCYSMRHSVATQLLNNNVDLMHIAELLGHASIRTTQNYLHIDISGLKKMHSLCHPRENGVIKEEEK